MKLWELLRVLPESDYVGVIVKRDNELGDQVYIDCENINNFDHKHPELLDSEVELLYYVDPGIGMARYEIEIKR